MSVIVSIALATICFTYQGTEECHPVLLGKSIPTPKGEYILRKRITADPGYGGDVLQFHETNDEVYAIHRVWLLNPKQKRLERLKSNNIQDRYISSGCINVDPTVYDRLMDCCSNTQLIIK
jgi:hypothetical protein